MELTRGILIVVEGIDGSGKSTLAKNVNAALLARGVSVVLTKEPGATLLGVQLRAILQNQPYPLCSKAEFLLFAADRAQHFYEVVVPSLAQKKIVISDRMADSSLVYQGYGRGLEKDMINMVNAWAMDNIAPTITFYVQVPYELARERIMQRNELTTFEKEHASFTQKIIDGFKNIADNNKNGVLLDGACSEQQLTNQAVEKIVQFIQNNNF